MKSKIFWLILILIVLGVVIWFVYSFYNSDPFKKQLVVLNEEIQEVINKEASELSECKSIAFGSKPCGGPWTFLVYSESSTDVSRLEELVSQYNEIDKERNQVLDLSSDCSVPNPPAISFENSACTP